VSRLGVPVELGATPFWLAAGYGDVEMMRILVAAGADPTLTSNDKTTPLMVAAGWNFLDGMDKYGRRWFRDSIAPVEQAALAAVKLCLELGLDVNAVNNDGETAMWGAVYLGGTAMAQLLFDHGAQINVKNKKEPDAVVNRAGPLQRHLHRAERDVGVAAEARCGPQCRRTRPGSVAETKTNIELSRLVIWSLSHGAAVTLQTRRCHAAKCAGCYVVEKRGLR
jgi:hypothetical protein